MKNIGNHPQGAGAPVEAVADNAPPFPSDIGTARRIWKALTAVYAAENGIEVVATVKRRMAAV